MDLERIYIGLRENAFKCLCEDNETMTSALIMDWNIGNGIMTLVCTHEGESSIYLSNGVGKIGAQDNHIKELGSTLIIESKNFIELAQKQDTTDLPDDDNINFFLLMGKDKFIIKETMTNIRNNNSQVIKLFEISNLIISKLMQS